MKEIFARLKLVEKEEFIKIKCSIDFYSSFMHAVVIILYSMILFLSKLTLSYFSIERTNNTLFLFINFLNIVLSLFSFFLFLFFHQMKSIDFFTILDYDVNKHNLNNYDEVHIVDRENFFHRNRMADHMH